MQVVPHGTKAEHKHIKTAVQPRKLVIMKTMNSIDVVNGEEMKIALPRIGTRCKLCGEPIDANNPGTWTHSKTPACPSIYVHNACMEVKRYHHGFVSPSGVERPLFGDTKETKEQIFMTPEVEINDFYGDWDDDEQRAAFLAQFNFWAEHDGSVFVELHPFTVANLHGMKERYRNLEKYVDMKDDSCGHHINASWRGMNYNDMNKIRNHARELFDAVQTTMRNNRNATVKVFGRYFTHYAEDNSYFSKYNYSWLNLDKSDVLEVRLFHYDNPEQITWGFMMVKEWMKTLRKYCNGEINSERASKQIKNEFVKVATGKATYQRAEQNSKI